MNNRVFTGPFRLARSVVAASALGVIGLVPTMAYPPAAARAAETSVDQGLVGRVGGRRITEADLIAADAAHYARIQSDFEAQRNQLERNYLKARYDMLQKQLDKLLDHEALELEAKARGKSTAEILAELKPAAPPTDEEKRAFYDAHRDRIKQPYEQIAAQLTDYVTRERNVAAVRAFYDRLREKHDIHSTLGPYRETVAATGPARGEPNAPVTIIEFADFQCPYCREAESSLRTLMAKHPHDLRLVFRNMPLTESHPNAMIAAEAGVCAERQGKFWEMHDAMYDDQKALAADALQSTATRLGLDTARFSACLADGTAVHALDADAQAAKELGLNGTPYFFVNGRPIDGSPTFEMFEGLIAEELQRARAHGG
jgi:predicted DsbA family dithiol-disulfide isomerase